MADSEREVAVDEADEKAGSRKKLVLVSAVIAVLLIGGGLAGYFFLLNGEADLETAEEGAEEPEPKGAPIYHRMDPVFVVNLPPGGKAKMLQVGLQVFTRDPTVGGILEQHGPLLRHHLLEILSNQQADTLYTRAGRQALQAALQDALQDRVAAVSGDQARIEALYFTQFVMQ